MLIKQVMLKFVCTLQIKYVKSAAAQKKKAVCDEVDELKVTREKLRRTRNKSIVPRRTMHTGRI